MGEVLTLKRNGPVKPREYVKEWKDFDYDSIASIFMTEVHEDFAFLIRSKLLQHNIKPTEHSVRMFCESISSLMGDMDLEEIVKEVMREHKGVILD